MSPASVQAAWPVGSDPMRSRSSRRAASWAAPPALRIAPSTPPPPMRPLFAALTTASTSCVVMSPRTRVICTMRAAGSDAGERVRVRPDPAGPVQRRQDSHLAIVQSEVEDGQVLADALRTHRLGDHDDTALQVPAQDDLRRCPGVRRRDGLDLRPVQQSLTATERAPRLRHDAEAGMGGAELVLRKAWMQFDLVDRGDDVALGDDPLQLRDREV